ncbi:MAG TPA: hypothetical protein VN457_06495, partial [Chlamydiales bacterium]|nr:hypothetical protein [Chlamydiales bacterium]
KIPKHKHTHTHIRVSRNRFNSLLFLHNPRYGAIDLHLQQTVDRGELLLCLQPLQLLHQPQIAFGF